MVRRILAMLVALLALASTASAGGSAETTVVVVNGDSPLSRRVANEYVALRDIPEGHVIVLRGLPGVKTISVDDFLLRIWKPIVADLEERGLEDHVDLVTYSTDCPFAVDFKSRLPAGNPGHVIGGLASLTGATYLARPVEAGHEFWNLQINRYFRLAGPGGARPAPNRDAQALAAEALRLLQQKEHGAAAKVYRKLLGLRSTNAGDWYNYACCLALIGKKKEALQALEQAAEHGYRNADHTSKDPDLETLREDARFKSILDGMAKSVVPFHRARALRFRDAWTGAEAPVDAPTSPDRYMLSTMLAYTGPRGNSLPEILNYLRRSASCDGTRPDGTVYLCRNGNVRSTTREPFFSTVQARLEALNRRVVVLQKGDGRQTGIVPVGREDVIGAVVGTASFNWEKSGSTLLPGAIAEHLTSFGAAFLNAGQTKLSEFMRHGAAGASGTVREPLALHHKFPNPMVHVFYAEGCSLAEAFYQSIWGPFQLLVVGDGLARPFATFRPVEAEVPPSPWKGAVTITAKDENRDHELWVDGKPVAFGTKLTLDTTTLADGPHDVRIVAVSRDRVATRTSRKLAVRVENHDGAKRRIGGVVDAKTWWDSIEVNAKGAKSIRVLHCGIEVASVQ
ncbi:MAG: TPR end-of-group domain-containing protein, partial [Planctomycetota bacterium]